MLTKFEVKNFKNFEETLVFDLTQTNNYKFNEECVVAGTVNKALIYGHNGTGKSNLGFALLDLVSHLTDNNVEIPYYLNYLNANHSKTVAHFKYEFNFHDAVIIYEYTKKDLETLILEKIEINGVLYAAIDRNISSIVTINASGAETLKTDIEKSKISILSYIDKNAVLESDDKNNKAFKKLLAFVKNMLFFRSLDGNSYIGLEQGAKQIGADIIEHGNLKKFESFLNSVGIECKLAVMEIGGKENLAFVFSDNKLIPFYDIASQGTKSLSLFYFWFQRLETDEVEFVFIDEFDAFYHHDLSIAIVKLLKKIDAQVIITTHNTSIMSNELLRPDCYFLLKNNQIKSLSNRTEKELREAHNIEKMYKAGSFGL